MRLLILVLVGLWLGCTNARKELADLGVAYTEKAFLEAAQSGDLAVVKLFVEAGMSVHTASNSGWPVLHFAAGKGRLEVVRFLVEHGADVKATGGWAEETALHWAAFFGHLEVVRYLVGQGADVNAKNSTDWTALAGAVSGGHTEVVAYLKSVGG